MAFNYSPNFPSTSDGFGVPRFGGGSIGVKRVAVAFDDAAAQTITLPEGAVIQDIKVVVGTAFDSGTSDLLNVGITGDLDKYVDDLNVAVAGVYRTGATSMVYAWFNEDPFTAETVLTVDVTSAGTAATAGALVVEITYYVM